MTGENEIKFSSGIDGLDTILKGGFKLPLIVKETSKHHGLVILIRGKPGSGKTTLALQIASTSLKWLKEDVDNSEPIYYTLDQPQEDIDGKIKILSMNEDKIKKDSIKITVKDSNYNKKADINRREEPFSNCAYSIEAVLKVRSDLTNIQGENKSSKSNKKWCRDLIAVDGLNCLENIDKEESLELSAMIRRLREISKVSILVYEPFENDTSTVEYLVDMTIDLKDDTEINSMNYFSRRLRITKSRYQDAFLGWNEYAIKDEGLEVYPSVYRYIHIREKDHMVARYEDSFKPFVKIPEEDNTGGIVGIIKDDKGEDKEVCDESILVRILGKIKRGSSTVLFGARRTSKSQLTMDFLRAGGRQEKNKKGLLLSFIDNQDTITQEASCLRKSCENYNEKCCRKCFENVFLFHLRSDRISPDEFFYFLKKRLDKGKESHENIRRLVFWDLTQLEFRFPLLSEDPMFLPALIDFLRQYEDSEKRIGISSLFMAAANTKLSTAASAMADNVIFCWRDKVKNESKTEKCYEEYIKKIGAKPEDVEKIEDFLVIYVDRAEGVIETTKRDLYCFPINYPEAPINDFKKEVLPYRVRNTNWLENASKELERIDGLQGVPR